MPDGPILYNTTASAVVGDNAEHIATVDPQLVVSGRNVIAVEVHQASTASTDLSFDLVLTAEQGAPPPVDPWEPVFRQGYLRWEVYGGIQGILVSDLTADASFPDQPTSGTGILRAWFIMRPRMCCTGLRSTRRQAAIWFSTGSMPPVVASGRLRWSRFRMR